jgi:2-polyprenyl-6-methoxyphenol hydroxylase-like FAD-dependent oxidoreductase
VLDRLPVKASIDRLRFHAHGHSAGASLPRIEGEDAPAVGVSRLHLDSALLAAAHECGVEIRGGERVLALVAEGDENYTLFSNAGEIVAPVIVAADGLNSGLRRQAGLESPKRGSRFGISAHVELDGPAGDAVDVHFRRGFEVYLTPVGPREVNVALLMSKQTGGQREVGLIEALGGHKAPRPPRPQGGRGI